MTEILVELLMVGLGIVCLLLGYKLLGIETPVLGLIKAGVE